MCLNCAAGASPLRQLPSRQDRADPRKAGNRSFPVILSPPKLDPVRSLRVRALLERCVMTGLGPQLFPHLPQSVLPLPQSPSTRGGARQALARQVAIYLGHVGCGFTYARIGRLYGRDRTTAAHACAVVEDRRDDAAFDRVLALLELCVKAEYARIEPASRPSP